MNPEDSLRWVVGAFFIPNITTVDFVGELARALHSRLRFPTKKDWLYLLTPFDDEGCEAYRRVLIVSDQMPTMKSRIGKTADGTPVSMDTPMGEINIYSTTGGVTVEFRDGFMVIDPEDGKPYFYMPIGFDFFIIFLFIGCYFNVLHPSFKLLHPPIELPRPQRTRSGQDRRGASDREITETMSPAEAVDQAVKLYPDLTKADAIIYRARLELSKDAFQQDIATHTGKSLRQVQRSEKKLASYGLLEVTRYHKDGKTKNRYRFPWPQVARGQSNLTHESDSPRNSPQDNSTRESHCPPDSDQIEATRLTSRPCTTTTSTTTNQFTLLENDNTQNSGTLDTTTQAHLNVLGINPHLTQPFHRAPTLIKKYTPAQILISHDPTGQIAANLAQWRIARDGGAEINDTPALIWAKIVEGKAPPPVPNPQPGPATIYSPPEPPPPPSPDENLWEEILSSLELQMPKLAFDCWLRETHLIERTDSTLIIEAPNSQAKEWLENRLHETIMRTVSNITGQSLEIKYSLPNSEISKMG